MKKITLLGTGKSSQHLIHNLYRHVESWNIELAIGDIDISILKKKYTDKPNISFFEFEMTHFIFVFVFFFCFLVFFPIFDFISIFDF